MKRHLFLCGPAFCGKSGLIRTCLGTALSAAGGFATGLSASEDGGLLGCTLFPAAAAGGVEGFEKALFLDLRSMPPKHDSEVFRGVGTQLLEEAAYYPFAVLDEIGGMDLIIPQFRVALDRLLDSELPILGVLKSAEAAEDLRRLLGPGERFRAFSDRLHSRLSGDPKAEILNIEENAEQEAKEAVSAWVCEYASLNGF
ncbi:MAG: hypothetical protein IJQ02_06660 [Oscillospiraceae bacterium]|nr:hypothetical protein [Oscillospiraceae bacterium]